MQAVTLYNEIMVALNLSKKDGDPDYLPFDETSVEDLPRNMAKMLMGARKKNKEVVLILHHFFEPTLMVFVF